MTKELIAFASVVISPKKAQQLQLQQIHISHRDHITRHYPTARNQRVLALYCTNFNEHIISNTADDKLHV